jgi:polyhydroxyalkanoate synthase
MASPFNVPDEFLQGFAKSGQALWQGLNLEKLSQLQQRYLQQQLALWASVSAGAPNGQEPVVATERGDRRFHAQEWRDNPGYSLLKQLYLLNADLVTQSVELAELEPREKHKLRFFARQLVDSLSPVNFAATNPEAIKLALQSQGQTVQAGLANLKADLERGRISITDETAFEVGRNVAVSKGSVVFQNDVFQLIQYAPLTAQVARRPVVIVPPCINKFYILDLQPENSFVRFACEQGQTVFLVSWRNPGAEQGNTTWDDYVELGAITALEVALAISGADKVNAVGWCVGGTILASALALLRSRGDKSVASMTLLTTMLDFSDPGDLGVFIDEQNVSRREASIGRGGLYPGSELGFVFQALRANDLIWPYVVNNYLKGKSPEAFDLLYWNADTTNLPGPMYAWYLRNMYLENNLCVPNRLAMCGEAVDLGRIDIPSYVLATQEDHIVPWRSAYRSTQLVGGKSLFVLGASGHIAGVINPASKNKRSFWSGGTQGEDADQWLETAQASPGSWWTHWARWLKPHAGKAVPAPKRLGNAKYKPIEPAPGAYVKVRAG